MHQNLKNIMPLTSFCGLLTLQVGVAVLSAVFFTLSSVILAANLFNYSMHSDYSWPVNLILVIVFVIGLVLAALLMFASSYGETRSLAIIALIVIVVLMCYWIILSCFSFASNLNHVNAVCVDSRCPETLWIANLVYRNLSDQKSWYDSDSDQVMYRDVPGDYLDNQDEKTRHSHNYHFAGAIVLFIINCFFFLFSCFVIWSWASELDWADYYIEDEPVVVYEDEPFY